ncbi:MAG: PAS domain S-box protein [Geobacteraceae bacterium]|nr:PAS domain S-box protein [Geobacteraceae bacterium]
MPLTIHQLKRKIRYFVGAILSAVIGISVWSIVSQYTDAITAAEQHATSYARVLAEHSSSAFAESDRVLLDVLRDLREKGGGDRLGQQALYRLLQRQSHGSPQIGTVFITGKDGTMRANSNQFPQKPINVADRDYFRYYLNNPGAGLTIGKPVMSRLVGRWRFNLMRPLARPGDSFAGIAAVAFEVAYFKKFLGPATLGPHGRVLLLRNDGSPLVSEPYTDNAYQTDYHNTVLFTKYLPAAPSGTYQVTHTTLAKDSRIVSYQRLERYPVIAVVSLNKKDVLEPWARKALFQSSMTLGLCLMVVLLVRLMFRQLDDLLASREVVAGQQEQLRIKAAQIDAANDAILLIDAEGRLVSFNQALCNMTGYTQEELTGIRLRDIEPPEFAAKILVNIRMLLEQHQATFESAYLTKDGRVLPIEVHARIMESDGFPRILSIVRDITQRKRDEMREQTRLKILEEMARGATLPKLLELIVHFVEQETPGALCSVLLTDETGTHLRHGAAPSLTDTYNRAVDGLKIAQGMGSCGTAAFTKQRVVVADIEGHPYWKGFSPAREAGLQACWSEPVLASDGELLGTFAMYYREPRSPNEAEIQLIESAAHLASIAIGRVRDETQRQKLEEQLLHIQKIEAIGQLAGGIAHDFNNLLTPIIVYADMVKRALPDDHSQARRVEGVLTAAHKAKDLTQKLLSFGRKQMLCMEVLDLNEVIDSFRDILLRTIRENIVIDVLPATGGACLRADRGQLEQVLLNLTVNAQDAIAGNGTISICTGHVLLDDEFVRQHHGLAPGPYILLAFKDTGCGMDEGTLRHIYEPFFTTKAVGHGTGLGLATVYGIVKQHEGYIEVRSRVGEGTTFSIYLPATVAEGLPAGVAASAAYDMSDHSDFKTILLVEDNQMVREMALDLLESNGFKVLEADSPSMALEIERSYSGAIDLLVTDVIMPGMNGMELFERLQERRPGLPVLYISGYTSDVVIHNGTLEEEVSFLKKPFTAEQLVEMVRRTMGQG